MEDDTRRRRGIEFEQNADVPRDTFAFPVVIGGKNDLGSLRGGSEFGNRVFLWAEFHVGRLPSAVNTYGSEFFF